MAAIEKQHEWESNEPTKVPETSLVWIVKGLEASEDSGGDTEFGIQCWLGIVLTMKGPADIAKIVLKSSIRMSLPHQMRRPLSQGKIISQRKDAHKMLPSHAKTVIKHDA